MKTIKLSYLSLAFVAIAFLMNSCSSSQQFAGVYPKNRITGKGIGQSVTQAKVEAPVVSVACADDAVAPAEVTNAITAENTPSATAHKQSKIEVWANKVTEKRLMAIAAANNGTTKSMFGIREKIQKKIFNKIAEKYGMDANNMSAASIERASKPLAIVSFATGIAAMVTWYGAFFFGPAAIATGIVALIGIKRGGDGKKWMAITGIALGAAGMFFWIIFTALIWGVLI